jgi:hypothetical protein
MSHKEYPNYGGLEKNFKGTKPKMSNTNEQAAMEAAKQKAYDGVKDGHFGCFESTVRCVYDHPKIFKGGFEAGWNAANQHARETEQEPYGHCDSCGKPCDGSGVCSCGGPIAINTPSDEAACSFCGKGRWDGIHHDGCDECHPFSAASDEAEG